MSFTVKGMYRDGKVELTDPPAGIRESRVLVTFLDATRPKSTRMMRYGQFTGERMSTEEDFAIAEWRGEAG